MYMVELETHFWTRRAAYSTTNKSQRLERLGSIET